MTDTERIELLEKQIQVLKETLMVFIDKYNWHDHKYDYSQNNNFDYDATTQVCGSAERVDSTDLKKAFP